jgi:hypothetical protein
VVLQKYILAIALLLGQRAEHACDRNLVLAHLRLRRLAIASACGDERSDQLFLHPDSVEPESSHGERMADLKIGRVAALVGVDIDTVRYYEKLGLLPTAPRRASGYRQPCSASS